MKLWGFCEGTWPVHALAAKLKLLKLQTQPAHKPVPKKHSLQVEAQTSLRLRLRALNPKP